MVALFPGSVKIIGVANGLAPLASPFPDTLKKCQDVAKVLALMDSPLPDGMKNQAVANGLAPLDVQFHDSLKKEREAVNGLTPSGSQFSDIS